MVVSSKMLSRVRQTILALQAVHILRRCTTPQECPPTQQKYLVPDGYFKFFDKQAETTRALLLPVEAIIELEAHRHPPVSNLFFGSSATLPPLVPLVNGPSHTSHTVHMAMDTNNATVEVFLASTKLSRYIFGVKRMIYPLHAQNRVRLVAARTVQVMVVCRPICRYLRCGRRSFFYTCRPFLSNKLGLTFFISLPQY